MLDEWGLQANVSAQRQSGSPAAGRSEHPDEQSSEPAGSEALAELPASQASAAQDSADDWLWQALELMVLPAACAALLTMPCTCEPRLCATVQPSCTTEGLQQPAAYVAEQGATVPVPRSPVSSLPRAPPSPHWPPVHAADSCHCCRQWTPHIGRCACWKGVILERRW